jgi:hypothetical protein
MSAMSMSAEAARRALEAAKDDDEFVRRYLDGNREAFATMQRLMQAAYPGGGPGEAPDDSATLAPKVSAAPSGDGDGAAMPDWLLKAGDAGFAPPKSPAHYQFDYAPNAEIDPAFDRTARDWMYKAGLPAGWSTRISREYQRRAAKPPSDDEVAQERELVHGLGDDRLIETLNRSGLGNDEWLIRQLTIHPDPGAAKAGEQNESGGSEYSESKGDSDAGSVGGTHDRDLAEWQRSGDSDCIGSGSRANRGSFIQLSDRAPNEIQFAEPTPGERKGGARDDGGSCAPKLPYSDIPITAGARGLVTLSGIPCSLNIGAILTQFGKYFLLVYAPLMIPTAIYVGAAGVGAVLRRARSVPLSKG